MERCQREYLEDLRISAMGRGEGRAVAPRPPPAGLVRSAGLALAHFQLYGARDGVDRGIVIFIDARLESAGANGGRGAQADGEFHCVAGRDGVEVENGLGGGETELFHAAALLVRALLLIILQVFTE